MEWCFLPLHPGESLPAGIAQCPAAYLGWVEEEMGAPRAASRKPTLQDCCLCRCCLGFLHRESNFCCCHHCCCCNSAGFSGSSSSCLLCIKTKQVRLLFPPPTLIGIPPLPPPPWVLSELAMPLLTSQVSCSGFN